MQRRRNKKKGKRKGKQGKSAYKITLTKHLTSVQAPRYGFIEPRMLSSMKYVDVETATVATGAGNTVTYRPNSVFAPRSSGGHQPYGFDQISTIYGTYRVLACRYKVMFAPSSDRLAVGILASDQQPTAVTNQATYSLLCESQGHFSKNAVLGFSGGPQLVVSGRFTLNALFGFSLQQYLDDDTVASIVTTNPANLAFFTIAIFNPTAGSVTTSYNVEFEFETIFYDPFLQNQS